MGILFVLLSFLFTYLFLAGLLIACAGGLWGLWILSRIARGRVTANADRERAVLLIMVLSATIASPFVHGLMCFVSLSR